MLLENSRAHRTLTSLCLLALISIVAMLLLSGCSDYADTPASTSNSSVAPAAAPASSSAPVVKITPVSEPQIIKTSAQQPEALPVNNIPAQPVKPTAAPVAAAPRNTPSRTLNLTFEGMPVKLYVPSNVSPDQPLQVLLSLHGVGGSNQESSAWVTAYAEKYKWLMVAPTVAYDPAWQDPKVILQEDPRIAQTFHRLFQALPSATGFATNPRVFIFGFSRGAQMAHRYATFYPEEVAAVSIVAAGSYTLPLARFGNALTSGSQTVAKPATTLNYPYGVADLEKYVGHPFNAEAFRHINFWLEVGELDNDPNATPPAWNDFLGRGRVERIRSYQAALKTLGISAQLTAFPNAQHQVTAEMPEMACQFFNNVLVQNNGLPAKAEH